MADALTFTDRVRVDGKFFRVGARKFHPRGVAYGPLEPQGDGSLFASPDAALRDLGLIRELGANVVRIYAVPPRWFLDLAQAHGLRLLVDVPWNQGACFLDSPETRARVRRLVGQAAAECGPHPAVFALSVANELRPDLVRWSGTRPVEAFLDELADTARAAAPDCLCTFGNYPTTEFLHPSGMDFTCFNVYLHDPRALRLYLARLQMLAGEKPLVLGEFGMDARTEGATRQAALLDATIEVGFRSGLAGMIAYTFTDEWFKEGRRIEDWHFGLTTRERTPRPAFATVQAAFQVAPYFPLRHQPKVSVVVASYNGARTLEPCLKSLSALRYPDYEILLVDDGSTDQTAALAARFPEVRLLRHPQNLGLSAARNTGIAAAQGEIIAFTDDDCRVDEDWLHYLVAELLDQDVAGVGGPNLPPADDSPVAAAVLVSPGGPTHVMLTDRRAEHIPGCNMAFWKRALLEVDCFDPVFRRAGDDVDLCWRLQQQGLHLGLSPAGFVWHARRSTVRAYLRQQHGYGEAEALLAAKHPEYFSPLGGSLWRGRIYSPAKLAPVIGRPMIYHGRFGTGGFQGLYAAAPSFALMAVTSLEYHVLVTLPLFALSTVFGWLLPVAIASALASLTVCGFASAQADLPGPKRRFWSRPLVALLYALQPLVRGWARYQARLFPPQTPLSARENLDSLARQQARLAPTSLVFADPAHRGRTRFIAAVLERLARERWPHRPDTGWGAWDIEVHGSRWSKLRLLTASEQPDDAGFRLRCRLDCQWTLPAKVVFGVTLGAALIGAALFHQHRWLAWCPLAAPTLLAILFHREQRNLRRVLAVFLEEVADAMGFSPLRAPGTSTAGVPVPPADGRAG